MDRLQLLVVSEEKDLGVIISRDLKWEKQCSAAVRTANKILGMIKRNFVDRSPERITGLYKNLVRSYLEYCCLLWNPYLVKDIKLIEAVQHRATEMVQATDHLIYDERLKNFGLSRPDKRRNTARLKKCQVL